MQSRQRSLMRDTRRCHGLQLSACSLLCLLHAPQLKQTFSTITARTLSGSACSFKALVSFLF
eukprot:766779-Hanusia_phi.AAC.1